MVSKLRPPTKTVESSIHTNKAFFVDTWTLRYIASAARSSSSGRCDLRCFREERILLVATTFVGLQTLVSAVVLHETSWSDHHKQTQTTSSDPVCTSSDLPTHPYQNLAKRWDIGPAPLCRHDSLTHHAHVMCKQDRKECVSVCVFSGNCNFNDDRYDITITSIARWLDMMRYLAAACYLLVVVAAQWFHLVLLFCASKAPAAASQHPHAQWCDWRQRRCRASVLVQKSGYPLQNRTRTKTYVLKYHISPLCKCMRRIMQVFFTCNLYDSMIFDMIWYVSNILYKAKTAWESFKFRGTGGFHCVKLQNGHCARSFICAGLIVTTGSKEWGYLHIFAY